MDIRDKIKLNLDDEFFKEEIRCDYKVTKKTKKIWAIELDLLNEFLFVCKKHNIIATVYGGTLLGAVRHKGMIPWDDDIDVCMTRDNYERLLKVANDEFRYPYFFQTALSDRRYFCGYARLRNSLTTGLILPGNSIEYNHGIYIDIYVLDGYIYDLKLLNRQILKSNILRFFANAYHLNTNSSSRLKKACKTILLHLIKASFCNFCSYKTIIMWYNKNLSRYNAISDRVSIMTHEKWAIQKYWCYLSDLESPIYLPFENIFVPAPTHYEEILTRMYGDYMKYPPIEKRGEWHNGSNGMIVFDPDKPYKEYMQNDLGFV